MQKSAPALRFVLLAAVAALLIAGCGDRSTDNGGDGSAGRHPPSRYLGPRESARAWMPSRTKPRSVVWAVGDAADGGPESEAVARMVARHRVHRLIYLGDVYENGTAAEFESNYRPLYGRYDRITAPTIGNHEWPNVATGYVPYWTRARGHPPPFWYASAASGWQLISLNANAPSVTAPQQLNWLRSEIRRTPRYGNCRIAITHQPFMSAGLHGDLSALDGIFDELVGHASIWISGHDHDMQRLRPASGITQLVDGAGGNDLYPVNRDDPRLAFFDDTHHGAVRLKLKPGRAVISFVATDGSLLNRSAVTCSEGG